MSTTPCVAIGFGRLGAWLVDPRYGASVPSGEQLTSRLEAATSDVCVAAFAAEGPIGANDRLGPRPLGRSISAMSDASEPAPASDLDGLGLSDEEKAVLAKVGAILRRLNYGTVVLVVQDGKVVQIEMAEKFRLR